MSKYVGFRVGDVHESHVLSEYYCGGCGYPVTDHDSFCPECGGAFHECDASDLDAENVKLRMEVTSLEAALDGMHLIREMDVAENDHLRTLARTLYYCGQDGKDCDQCAMNGADMRVRLSETEHCDGVNALVRKMRLVD